MDKSIARSEPNEEAIKDQTRLFFESLVQRAVDAQAKTISDMVESMFYLGGRHDGLAAAALFNYDCVPLCRMLAEKLSIDADEALIALKNCLNALQVRDFALSGAEAVVLILREAGVHVAFGYPGTSELALCDSLGRSPEIRLINSRGDKECAFMAAGASLLIPGCSVGVLHGARGLTNAAGGIADAHRNEVGSIFITGLPSTSSAQFLPPHAEEHLLGAIGNFAKWTYEAGPIHTDLPGRPKRAAEFIEAVRNGIRKAKAKPCGPVLIGLPQDVAETKWIAWSQLESNREYLSVDAHVSSNEIDDVAKFIAGYSYPVILLDDYLLKYNLAQETLANFSAAIGAPVLQLRYRRGPMLFERVNPKRVPSFLGWFDPADKNHRRVLAEADLLITLEDRNLYPRVVGELPTRRKLAITSNRRKAVKNQYLRDQDRVVEGNVIDILHSLTASIVRTIGQRQAWYSTRFGELTERASIPHTVYRARSSLIGVLGEAMRSVENPIIIDDSQMFGGLVSTEYDRLPDHVRVFGDHGGFVGGGLAYATGLAISDANLRVFCLLGDQGFTNAIQGLVAAKQERARVTYIVCNNGESVSLFTQAAVSCPGSFENGSHSFLKNIEGFEYARLAEGMGIDAFVVEFPTEDDSAAVEAALSSLTMALKSAATIQGPVLIELKLPARGDFWDGIWITSGFEETKSGTLPALPA